MIFVFHVNAQVLPPSLPQNPVYSYQGSLSTYSFDIVGDLTGDGIKEILVGERGPLSPTPIIGTVKLIDVISGTIIRTFTGTTVGGLFGSSLASLGDVNNNGVSDFVVGEEYANGGLGAIYVYELTGNLLYTISPPPAVTSRFGIYVAKAGDITGDGVNDILVGNVFPANAHLYNGATGALINTYNAIGNYPTSLGDITGDGVPDVAIGHWQGFNPLLNQGAVRVYSGTGALLATLTDGVTNSFFGICVENGGDIDGDTINDILVCASGNGGPPGINPTFLSKVYVYSGATFSQIGQLTGYALYDSFGISTYGADVNKDGYKDIIVGIPGFFTTGSITGRVDLFRGPSLAPLYSWINNQYPIGNFGLNVFGGDINGDGFDEIFISSNDAINPIGRFNIYSYGGVWKYGSGPLGFIWTPTQGPATGTVTIIGAAPNSQGFLLTSTSPASIPLSPGNTLLVNPAGLLLPFPFTFSPTGKATFSGISLLNAAAAGTNLYFQAAELIPGQPANQLSSYRVSNALQIVLVA